MEQVNVPLAIASLLFVLIIFHVPFSVAPSSAASIWISTGAPSGESYAIFTAPPSIVTVLNGAL